MNLQPTSIEEFVGFSMSSSVLLIEILRQIDKKMRKKNLNKIYRENNVFKTSEH